MRFWTQNWESICLPCVHAGMHAQAQACKQNKPLYYNSKGSFMIGWILAWLFLVNERPYPQPNIEIRKPKKELKVTLISVTICSLIFFICTLKSAGLRPWHTGFVVLVAHKFKLRCKFLKFDQGTCFDLGVTFRGILHHLDTFGVHGRAPACISGACSNLSKNLEKCI